VYPLDPQTRMLLAADRAERLREAWTGRPAA